MKPPMSGKVLRLGGDVELQGIDGAPQHRARLEQFDLGHRLGHRVRPGNGFRDAGNAGLLRLDLDHRARAVDGRGDDRIGNAEQGKEGGNGENQCLVIERHAQNTRQVDAIVSIVFQ